MSKKEESKLEEFYKDKILGTDDEPECKKIAEMAIKVLKKNFKIGFTSPELILSFYAKVFDTLFEILISKRNDFNEYRINVADRFEIGYSDAEDDGESEKIGSFVPFMYPINNSKKEFTDDEESSSVQRCVQWNAMNITEQKSLIDEIASKSVKNMKSDLELQIGSKEIVIPVFITIHEQMIAYLRVAMVDEGVEEKILNFASCFDVISRINDDGDTDIEYAVNIESKLLTKSDEIASSKYE